MIEIKTNSPKKGRVNVYLSSKMKEFYVSFAKEMGVSMSSAMVMALKIYMDSQKGLLMKDDLQKLIEKIKS